MAERTFPTVVAELFTAQRGDEVAFMNRHEVRATIRRVKKLKPAQRENYRERVELLNSMQLDLRAAKDDELAVVFAAYTGYVFEPHDAGRLAKICQRLRRDV